MPVIIQTSSLFVCSVYFIALILSLSQQMASDRINLYPTANETLWWDVCFYKSTFFRKAKRKTDESNTFHKKFKVDMATEFKSW